MTGRGVTARSAILKFDDDRSARYEEDGLLVIGPDATGRQVVRAVGAYAALAANSPAWRSSACPDESSRRALWICISIFRRPT